ncbi:MAG: M3 family metallopeptidase [Bacteroidales bacterium]|nr:M3 family metallopeptidase [Bacteroidales bacterium]
MEAKTPQPTTCDGDNPLLSTWTAPHAAPPFDRLRNEHYEPAVEAALAEAEANIAAIERQREAPTFDNTCVALERADRRLSRIVAVMDNLNECDTSEELQQIVLKLSPVLTRFSSQVYARDVLFDRIRQVFEQRETLDAEQRTLVERQYRAFLRHGACLSADERTRFAQNSEELATLSLRFNSNVLADGNSFAMHLTSADDLSGLPPTATAAAREEAQRRGLEGWVFTLAAPSYIPFLTYADRRDLRERMWRAYNSRGNRGGETDNNAIVARMVALRADQARLLGFEDYDAYVLSDRMAETKMRVSDFMQRLINAAYPAAVRELQEVQDFARQEGADFDLQRWDFSYYAERLKQARYVFDAERLRPYFALEQVRQGIFQLYATLYGLRFEPCNDRVPRYHPDVETYEVFDGDRFMAVLYLDLFPRASKRSGAWMTEFRGQWRDEVDGDTRPLIQVVCNFTRPTADTPALLTPDEVETFMHEMGHAMHGILSDVRYETLCCTNVLRDFVELPSQLMENWCREPEFLHTFARHYQSGNPLPDADVAALRRSENFLSGWLCLRQLSLGLVDLAFHGSSEPLQGKVEDFERRHMIELLPAIPGCNTSTAFTHIFSGGYAAGYYGYKWAEVLDADVFGRFRSDGIFNRETAVAFRREVLSKGGSLPPSELFRNFMGRDPDADALLRRSGLLPEA